MEAYNYNYQQIQIPNNYPIYENSINEIKSNYINHSNNGSYNYTTIVSRVTDILKRHGLQEVNQIQKI